MPGVLPPVVERSNLPQIYAVNFWIDHEPIGETGEMRAIEWVRWAKKGSGMGSMAASVEEKVDRIRKHNPANWAVLEPAYNAWKKGEEEPVNGTPLEILSFLSKQQVMYFKSMHLRTAEDLAELTDGDLGKLGMGAQDIRRKAKAFVHAKENEGKTAIILAHKEQQIEMLQGQVSELMAAVNDLKRTNDAKSAAAATLGINVDVEKPIVRRGRQPRNNEEAA